MNNFSNSFTKGEATNADEEDFDPFNIGVVAKTNAEEAVSPVSPASAVADDNNTLAFSTSSALPPRIFVKFKIEEEVSSVSHVLSAENGGSSDVQIEGTLLAQVVSSDALKNIPFLIIPSTNNNEFVEFLPNASYAKKYTNTNDRKSKANVNIVNIPKENLGFVNVGNYRISRSMEHMPLLLEQKIVRSKSNIHIALQVRSKLSNPDDLSEFSIALFVPKQVDAKSVSIEIVEGAFDPWKRCIIWEKKNLPKGQSFMLSARCSLDEGYETPQGASVGDGLKFPVMLRCRSKDQISSVRFEAAEANYHPASVSSSVVGQSYRIVHRLK